MLTKKLPYSCKNGAYHDYACCNTCWNTHPVAEKYFKGEDFRMTETFERIRLRHRRREFEVSARKAGFTEKQIEFLFGRI